MLCLKYSGLAGEKDKGGRKFAQIPAVSPYRNHIFLLQNESSWKRPFQSTQPKPSHSQANSNPRCRLAFSTERCEILSPRDRTIRAAIREQQGTDSLHFPAPVKASDRDRKKRGVNSREGCVLSSPPSPRRDPSLRAGPAWGCSPERPKGRGSRAAPGRGQGRAGSGARAGRRGERRPFPSYLPAGGGGGVSSSGGTVPLRALIGGGGRGAPCKRRRVPPRSTARRSAAQVRDATGDTRVLAHGWGGRDRSHACPGWRGRCRGSGHACPHLRRGRWEAGDTHVPPLLCVGNREPGLCGVWAARVVASG